MQLLLDGDQPTLVVGTKGPGGDLRCIEFHTENSNGTTTMTACVVLGPLPTVGDDAAVGALVRMILS